MARLCSQCFVNEGIKREAYKIGTNEETLCPNCGRRDGAKLNRLKTYELFGKFFVSSSAPQNVGGHAPVFQLSNEPQRHQVKFYSSLQGDYELLERECKQYLFFYGPPLWMLGMTTHYNDIDEGGKKEEDAITEIINQSQIITIPGNSKLYRVRLNMEPPSLLPSDFDTPPPKQPEKCDRFDTVDVPIFYASFDVETCLHECRVTVADEITLATFRTNNDIAILNLADSFSKEGQGTSFDSVECTMDGLCSTDATNYDKCRKIAKAVYSKGYEGFKYKSYYSFVKPNVLLNIALFGYPVKEGILTLESINRVKLRRLDYDYSFGPAYGDGAMYKGGVLYTPADQIDDFRTHIEDIFKKFSIDNPELQEKLTSNLVDKIKDK